MSRSLGAVDFEDGRRLYLIFDGTVGIAWEPLFMTPEAAWEWYDAGSIEFAEPVNAAATALPVVLTPDLKSENLQRWQFATRASADAMWITGPLSSEAAYNERVKDDEPFGYGIQTEKPVN